MEYKTFSENEKLQKYLATLSELRKDGSTAMLETKQRIDSLKDDKMLSKEEARVEKERLQAEYAKAKEIATSKKDDVLKVQKEALSYSKEIAKDYLSSIKADSKDEITKIKNGSKEEIASIKAEYGKELSDLKSKLKATSDKDEKLTIKNNITTINFEKKNALNDKKACRKEEIGKCKDRVLSSFTEYVQTNRTIRGGKTNVIENIQLSFKSYVANFEWGKFFLNNGIYLAIIVFFIVCIIAAPLLGMGRLLTLPNILTILEQGSTRMFYALGVAGLILLAGTDLSIGRMVALGSITTGLILHPGRNIVKFMNMGPWDFSAIPMFFRVIMALFLAILFCSLFSAFAGVFTAKLKMHPFISTLATQLIIYGLLFFGTSGVPTGSIDDSIREKIGGRWFLGYVNGNAITFPKLIIPAIIAIIVAWFIWNKTTFGKNMYAVGGNPEAAAVSGISVFKTTMLIFIMAGIFYGCGSFLEAFRANASAGTGQGFETDAIAACVVGGISFSGGIGKISGAVIGVIIFTSLTYCLTFLGIDTNLQFVFKGLIILAAVALDSVKYLKKK